MGWFLVDCPVPYWFVGICRLQGGRGGWLEDLASGDGSVREGERRHRRQHGCRR
jgi:hypothetical protein